MGTVWYLLNGRKTGAFAVLGLFVMLLCQQAGYPESTGIIISKEGNDVNVAIDTSRYPDLKIQRNDGKMVIEVPNASKSDASRMIIDSALKKSGLVSVSESGTGKTVTVNSQDVYLSIQDLTETTLEDTKPAKPTAAKAAAKTAPVPAPVVTVKTAEKPRVETQAPKVAAPVKAAVTPVVVEKPQPKVETVVRQPLATVKTSNVDNMIGKSQGLKATESILKAKSALVEATGTDAAPVVETEAQTSQVALAPVETPITTAADNTELEDEKPADPESVPLSYLEEQRKKLSGESSVTLLRLLGGLIVVLGMALAFMKLLLPKLVAKYPDFFEKLRRKNDSDPYQVEPPYGLHDTEGPVGVSSIRSGMGAFDDLAPPPGKKPSFFEPKPGNFLTKREPSKKQYLEHLKMGDDSFNVLTSTKLGKGKELHLVEVKGRELVIATTPYTVTLVADLSNPDATPDMSWQHDDETGKTSTTRAFLEEHTGRNSASDRASQSLNKRFSTLQNHENLYRKYLDDDTATPDKSRRQPPPFVDAEEVVVLEDYDDIYG